MLIIGRAVAGAGAAALFSGGMTIVAYSVPLRKRAIYIAALSSMFGIASVVGPILGGALTDKASWRWVCILHVTSIGAPRSYICHTMIHLLTINLLVFLDKPSFWCYCVGSSVFLLQQSTKTTYGHVCDPKIETNRYAGCILPHLRHCQPAPGVAMGRNCISVVQQQSLGMHIGIRTAHISLYCNAILAQGPGNDATEDSPWPEDSWCLCFVFSFSCHGVVYVSTFREQHPDR